MPPDPHPPDDPRHWLARARSDLAIAAAQIEGAFLEDLCFHAQQAAEKALKALLLHRGIRFPYVHDLAELVHRLELAGVALPGPIREAVRLTDYAVEARYPGPAESVTEQEWQEALRLAREVVRWVNDLLPESD